MDEGSGLRGGGKEGRSVSGFRAGLVLDGRYRLERPLGEGGMGTVWVGHQLALQREVAVKSLRVAGASLRTRLTREALALAAVHHPSIVQVYDYGETEGGTPYIVMELVRGESLAARLERLGTFPAEEAVALMLPLLDGLATAHKAGIVHRDVKPDNVVLAIGPAGVLPKLLDFGIARVDRSLDPDLDPYLTTDSGIVGTPAYMAPEQLRGVATDERADVWSVGAMLYHLLAGEPPFAANDVQLVMRRVLLDPPPYPRKARGLDGRLWGILMAALRKTPSDRTPSALALRKALAGWLDARAGVASRPAASSQATLAPASSSSRAASETTAPSPSEAARAKAALTPTMTAPSDDPPSFDALIRAKLGRD